MMQESGPTRRCAAAVTMRARSLHTMMTTHDAKQHPLPISKKGAFVEPGVRGVCSTLQHSAKMIIRAAMSTMRHANAMLMMQE